jgi:hypothetical protein
MIGFACRQIFPAGIYLFKKAELSKMLSADQMKRYDELMAERRKIVQGPPM